MNDSVIVIGAGVAGLTAAYRLRTAGLGVTVLESAGRVGGRMSTLTRDGYRVDLGASLLPTSYRQMLALIADAGLAGEITTTSSLFGLIRDGRVHRFRAGKAADVPGIWIHGGRHVLLAPLLPPRYAGNTLVWQRGAITFRLEGRGLTQAGALRLARTLR